MRAELQIPSDSKINIIISLSGKAQKELIEEVLPYLRTLGKLQEVEITSRQEPPKSSVSLLVKDVHVFIPLEGVVDLEKERARIKSQIEKGSSELKGKEARLKNKDFLGKAPCEVVEKEKARVEELKEQLIRLKRIEDELK